MNDISIVPPAVVPPPPEKRVWDFWPTVGYGAVVLIAFVVVQVLVGLIAGLILVLPQLHQLSGTLQLDEIVSKIKDVL